MKFLLPILVMSTFGPAIESGNMALSAASSHINVFVQTALQEIGLPAMQYQQLRLQALVHARLTTGPRIQNPRIADHGLDRDVAASLAEQRLWRQSHSGATVASVSPHALLADRETTLLTNAHASDVPLPQPGPSATRQMHPSTPCVAPAIRTVNGKAAAPVFTPAEPDNHFRIEGCAFGDLPGIILLQPSVRTLQSRVQARQITLRLEGAGAWNDNAIDAYIDARLVSLPDFVADLIIRLPDGREAQLSGCVFVASRPEPQLLKSIPASLVALDATATRARAIQQLEFESPPFTSEQVPAGAQGTSAFVARSDPDRFTTGRDSYDLSPLAPGWVIESVQLIVFDPACPGEDDQSETQGNWTTNWTVHGFVIAWASETCASRIPPFFNFTLNSSQYAVRVWLVGPAGTQPLPRGF